jgi:hypothetical protein
MEALCCRVTVFPRKNAVLQQPHRASFRGIPSVAADSTSHARLHVFPHGALVDRGGARLEIERADQYRVKVQREATDLPNDSYGDLGRVCD